NLISGGGECLIPSVYAVNSVKLLLRDQEIIMSVHLSGFADAEIRTTPGHCLPWSERGCVSALQHKIMFRDFAFPG
ncbi:hypothetical protein ANANG_G00094180, partial [Anguilla anguilla]